MNKEYVFVGTAQLKTRDYINQLEKENKELKKQLENKYSKTGILTNEVLYEENTKLINQQKEFINCLEDEYTKIQSEIEKETNNNAKYFKIERRQTITGILQKYKEIIGGKDEVYNIIPKIIGITHDEQGNYVGG